MTRFWNRDNELSTDWPTTITSKVGNTNLSNPQALNWYWNIKWLKFAEIKFHLSFMCNGPNCSARNPHYLLACLNLALSVGTIHMPPPTNHWRGIVIVYLLFTEEKPLYFLLINNWHVWVGWGTKSHSNVHGYRADCVFVLCARADNRLSSPHGSLSSPRGFFVWAELRVINGNTLSYLVLRSVQLEKVELTTSYIHSNLILQTVGISHIRETQWQWIISPHELRNILLK